MSSLSKQQHFKRQKLNQARDILEISSDKRGVVSRYLLLHFLSDEISRSDTRYERYLTPFVLLKSVSISFDTGGIYHFLAIFSLTY